ncbi:hypothetical protein Q9295_00360 [Xinfangfangia sp. CPCC 101601]|uniref:Cytochrome-c oxidase n=1 Tax=Pseudogemmobacter lacusdianii TaxID=3069608 RepID=A0ABU0VSV4_9RHOB|nr:hypothetical protein [Xinfangfangia sp. CPCC 101601]MDQ2064812.1 hypothetical protein [Xinfangfangia sp. CPCC 101601]
MNVSSAFLKIAALYLLVGMMLGIYMGGSGDHSLVSVHAHINLLGFTLMVVFGLLYRFIPGLAEGWMGKTHFWLHQLGALVLLIALYLMMSGRLPASTVGPVLPLAEGALIIGTAIFAVNLWRRV